MFSLETYAAGGLSDVFTGLDISTTLSTLVKGATDMAVAAAPIILGGLAIFAAVKIGMNVAKRFMNKVG